MNKPAIGKHAIKQKITYSTIGIIEDYMKDSEKFAKNIRLKRWMSVCYTFGQLMWIGNQYSKKNTQVIV